MLLCTRERGDSPQTVQDVEALEDVLELRVELVEVGAVHVVPVAPHEGHALRREAVGALVELPHHLKALWAYAPLVKMYRAHMFLQCSVCGAPGITLVAGKVLHFKVNKLAVTVQVLNLFSTVWTCLLHAQMHSL